MARKIARRSMPDSYFALVKELPLTHIRDDKELDVAQRVIDRLLQQELDKGAEEYLDALTDLVEIYEDQCHPIPDASDVDVLRELMRSNAFTQASLAKKAGIAQSTVSAVLNGERTLTKDQVVRLAKLFNVSPLAFLPT